MDESQQDTLRTVRTFVGALAGGLAAYGNDQSYAAYDAYSGNSPYRYQTISPYGVGVEGLPISATRSGGLVISPMLVIFALGVGAVLLLKR